MLSMSNLLPISCLDILVACIVPELQAACLAPFSESIHRNSLPLMFGLPYCGALSPVVVDKARFRHVVSAADVEIWAAAQS